MTTDLSILGEGGWESFTGGLAWNKYIPIQPTPKQLAFLLLNCEEAFYGGAAGGGKSAALLAAALQYVTTPGYAAIIFRKTYADLVLPGALMFVAQEWLGETDAKWCDQTKTWTFPSGATLSFGYLDNANDHFRYQSSEFQFVGFDELTQFRDYQYKYVGFSRKRRKAGVNIPLRVRSASNPGGAGHEWVKQRFITEGIAKGRVFIPANLDDNPYIDREAYIRSLGELDLTTRLQLLRGDWTARASGTKFRREWFEIVDVSPGVAKRARYWDLAATEVKTGNKDPDWTVGALMSRAARSGLFYLEDIKRTRATPAGVQALIEQTAKLDGKEVTIYMEQEPGASGVNNIAYYRRVLARYAFYAVRSTGSKEVRAYPLSAQAEAGNVKLLAGAWIGDFLDEAEGFPAGSHDDQVDAASGAYDRLCEQPEEVVLTYDSMEAVGSMDL